MITIDVLGNGNCMLHSIALAYLLPVVKDEYEFKNRLQKLFGGDGDLSDLLVITKDISLLKNSFNDEYFSCITGQVEWNKIIHSLRGRIVDFIADDHEDSCSNVYEQFFPKNDVLLQREQFEESTSLRNYLVKIRQANVWLNEFVIKAASDFLCYPISVNIVGEYSRTYNSDLHESSIQLIYINKCHYKFCLNKTLDFTILKEEKLAPKSLATEIHSDSSTSSDDEPDDDVMNFLGAVRKNDYETVKKIINSSGCNVQKLISFKDRNYKEDTALHTAIRNKLKSSENEVENQSILNVIKLLIKHKADIYVENSKKETPVGLIDKRLKKSSSDPHLKLLTLILISPDDGADSKIHAKANRVVKDRNFNRIPQPLVKLATFNRSRNMESSQTLQNTNGQKIATRNDDHYSKSSAPKKLKRIETYSASGVKTSLHGVIYQLQLLMMFMFRASNQFVYFDLATEMDQAEKFDDLVFRHRGSQNEKWSWSFLQAKHKLIPESSQIHVKDLLSDTDGDFSIIKYFISFCKIRSNPVFVNSDLIDFTLLTNTYLDFSKKAKRNNDGSLSVDSKRHNELVTKWEGHFNFRNCDKHYPLLFFNRNIFKAKICGFNKTAYSDLESLMHDTFVRKSLEFKCNKNLKYITQKLKAINILKYKHSIEDANRAVQKLTVSAKGKEPGKLQFVEAAKKILNFEKGILEVAIYNKFNDLSKVFSDSKNKKGSQDYLEYRENLYDAMVNILQSVNNIVSGADKTLALFSDKNASEFKHLHEDLNFLGDLKNYMVIVRQDIVKSCNVDDVKKALEDFKEASRKSLDEICKQSEVDLEGAKRKIFKILENIISDIVILEMTLDSKLFTDYLKEFLDKFQFIISYPDVDQLNSLLRMELGNQFYFLDADLISDSFETEVLNWLKHYNKGSSNFFSETSASAFFKSLGDQIQSVMTSGLNKAYPDKLQAYKLSFNEDGVMLKDFLASSNNVLHVSTQATRLTAIKILQILKNSKRYSAHDSYIFMRLKSIFTPEIQKLIFNAFSSDHNYHLLVVECQRGTDVNSQNFRYICEDILFRITTKKKVVFIAPSDDLFINEFKALSNFDVETSTDRTSFLDLSHLSQKVILNKNIMFQGKAVSLSQLVGIEYAARVIDENESNLQFLVENDFIEIGDTSAFSFIGYVPDYYIDRYLHLQKLNVDAFQLENAIFLVTRASKDDLASGLGIGTSIFSWNPTEEYKDGIVLSSVNDSIVAFKKLCMDNPKKSVHWFELRHGVLLWKDSKGNFEEIQPFIDHNFIPQRADFSKEDSFIKPEQARKVVVVANDPGVGKSTVITSISRKMKEDNETLWINRVNLNHYAFDKGKLGAWDSRKHTKCLDEIPSQFDLNFAIDFITDMVIPIHSQNSNDFQRKLFKVGLSTHSTAITPRIVIFFDGFDEISPKYKEKTIDLLKKLNKSAVVQMWITTRLHEKQFLEMQLRSPAYVLSPFNEPDQISFLHSFWHKCLMEKIVKFVDKERVEEIDTYIKEIVTNIQYFIEWDYLQTTEVSRLIKKHSKDVNVLNQILDSLLENMDAFASELIGRWKGSIRDTDKAFINIPLQLKMLAEVIFGKRFELPENIGLVQLYDDFVLYKLEIFYYDKFILSGNVGSDEVYRDHMETLRNEHRKLAVKVFFSDLDYMELQNECDVEEPVKLARVGLLVWVSESRLEFVHRSFAEYFLSEYLMRYIQRGAVQKVLLEEVLILDDFFLVTIFFNEELGRHITANIVLKEDALSSINRVITDAQPSHSFLHRSCVNCQTNIISFFIQKLIPHQQILEDILLKPGKYGKFALYDIIYNPIYKISGSQRVRVVEVFLKELQDQDRVVLKLMTHRCYEMFVLIGNKIRNVTIFQMALFGSINTSIFKMLIDHIKLRKDLFKIVLFENGLEGDGTFLHFSVNKRDKFSYLLANLLPPEESADLRASCIDVIKELLLAKNSLQRTVLHLLAFRGYHTCITELLDWIVKNHVKDILSLLINCKDGQNLTPLDTAVYIERCPAVVAFLNVMEKHMSIEEFNDSIMQNSQKNILYKAICQGRRDSAVALLDWFRKYFQDDTTLTNLLLIRSIVCGRTSLSIASARDFGEIIEALFKWLNKNLNNHFFNIFWLLLLQQADSEGKTPLHEAVYWKCVKAVRCLMDSLTILDFEARATILFMADKWKKIAYDYETDIRIKSLLRKEYDTIITAVKSQSRASDISQLNIIFSQNQLESIERFVNLHLLEEQHKQDLLGIILNIKCLMCFDSPPKQDITHPTILGLLPGDDPRSTPESVDLICSSMDFELSANQKTTEDTPTTSSDEAVDKAQETLRLRGGASLNSNDYQTNGGNLTEWFKMCLWQNEHLLGGMPVSEGI